MEKSKAISIPSTVSPAFIEGINAFLKGKPYNDPERSKYRVGSFEWAVYGVGWSTAEGWNLPPEGILQKLSQIKNWETLDDESSL